MQKYIKSTIYKAWTRPTFPKVIWHKRTPIQPENCKVILRNSTQQSITDFPLKPKLVLHLVIRVNCKSFIPKNASLTLTTALCLTSSMQNKSTNSKKNPQKKSLLFSLCFPPFSKYHNS